MRLILQYLLSRLHARAQASLSARSSPSFPLPAAVEALEERRVLSANVLASLKNGSLFLKGDRVAANSVALVVVDGNLVARGYDGTTINGATEFLVQAHATQVPRNLVVKFGVGNDTLLLGPGVSVARNIKLNLGAGNDRIGAQDIEVGGAFIGKTGLGNDVLALHGSEVGGLRFVTGLGNDSICVETTSFQSNVKLKTSSGADLVAVDNSAVSGKLVVSAGSDNDTLIGLDSVLSRGVTAKTGQGNDNVYWAGSQVNGPAKLLLSSGDDLVVSGGANQFRASSSWKGSFGFNDRWHISNDDTFNAAPHLVGFESQNVPAEVIEGLLQDVSQRLSATCGVVQSLLHTTLADGTFTVTAGETLTVTANNGLASLAHGTVVGTGLTISLIQSTAHGVLLLNSDGSFTYAPAPGFTGDDTFQATAFDGVAVSDLATFTVHVLPASIQNPSAIADAATTIEDDQLTTSGDVLENDTSPVAGSTLTVVSVNQSPANVGVAVRGLYGTLLLAADGSFSYTLDNTSGAVQALTAGQFAYDVFSYTISDGHGGTATSTLTITVEGTDEGPIAAPDSANAAEDVIVTVSGDVVTNDIDAGHTGSLAIAAVNGEPAGVGAPLPGTYGSPVIQMNGAFSYDLNNSTSAVQALAAGETVSETYTYTVVDGAGRTATTTLTFYITGINDQPVAGPDTATLTSRATDPAIGNVLDNDTDPDLSDTHTVTKVNGLTGQVGVSTAGTYGNIVIQSDGSYAYTVNVNNPTVLALGEGQTLEEVFSYQISDNHGGTDTGSLTITITGTNTPPSAADDSASILEDAASPVSGNVLANDTDLNGDALQVTQVNADGGSVGQSIAGNYGSLVLNANGSFTFAINNLSPLVQALSQGQVVQDSFAYSISDGHGGDATANLNVSITGTNDAPTASSTSAATVEDTTVTASGNVLLNCSDIDAADVLAVSQVNGLANQVGVPVAGSFGSLVLNSDGTYVYTLDNSVPGVQGLAVGLVVQDSFLFTINDGHGGTASTSLIVSVTGTNDAPVTVVDTNTVAEDGSLTATGNVLANDSDPDLTDVLFVSQVAGNSANVGNLLAGTYGALTLNSDGTYSYQLNNLSPAVQALAAGQTVYETFSYSASDGHGGTTASTLSIAVTGSNDAPTASATAAATMEDTTVTASGNVLLNCSDIDAADVLAVSQVNGLANQVGVPVAGSFGSLVLNGNGTYVYTLDNSAPGVQGLAVGQVVQDSFLFTIDDGHGGTATTSLVVSVTGTNDAPTTVADTNTVAEDGTLTATGNVLANDSDPDLTDVVFVSQVGGNAANVGNLLAGAFGTITLNSDGSYSYQLNNSLPAVQALAAGQTVYDSFSYSASDGHGGTTASTLSIAVTGSNDGPSANTDLAATQEDGQAALTGNLLSNDSDSDTQDVLHIATVDGQAGNVGTSVAGSYGSLTVNADGSYSYVLNNASPAVQALAQSQVVLDIFQYQATDGQGGFASSTLMVTVIGVNDLPQAVADLLTIPADQTAPLTGNILGNDTDVDTGDDLTVTLVNGSAGNVGSQITGSYGALVVNADGSLTYQLNTALPAVQNLPRGGTLQDSFTYTISDGKGGTSSASVTVTVTGKNQPVVTTPDAAGVIEDDQLTATGNVLLNDTDADNDPITVASVNGQAGNVGVAVAGNYGSLTLQPDGSYLYTLNNALSSVQALAAGETLTDAFTYTATDGMGGNASALLTVTITGTNDDPVAQSDEVQANPVDSIVSTGNVLDNDNDPDAHDLLSVSQVNGSADNVGVILVGTYGSLIINADGTYTYTLNVSSPDLIGLSSGQTGNSQYSYQVSDGSGGTDSSTLNVTVTGTNDAPQAAGDAGAVTEDGVLTAAGNVLTNDTDSDGDPLTVAAVQGSAGNVGVEIAGTYGRLVLNANGTFTYTLENSSPAVQALAAGQAVQDNFSYTADDGQGGTATANLVVTVTGANDTPGTAADFAGTQEDSVLTTTGNLLDNDLDPDTLDDLFVASVNGNAGNVGLSVTGTYGSITIQADGSYVYTLNNSAPNVQALSAGQSVQDVFTYSAADGHGGSAASSITVTVQGTNDLPVANDDTDSILEDSLISATGNVLTNDTDVDALDTLTVAQVNGAAGLVGNSATGTYGSIVINADGSYTYTLDPLSPLVQALAEGQIVEDSFTYQASDGHGGTALATLNMHIIGVNDIPVVGDTLVSVLSDLATPFAGNALTGVSDPDTGDSARVAAVNGSPANVGNSVPGNYGTMQVNSDGSYSYLLNNLMPALTALASGQSLTDPFTVLVADDYGGTVTKNLTMTILGVNDLPVLTNDANSILEDAVSAIAGNVLSNDSDPDTGDLLHVAQVAGSSGNVGNAVAGTYGTLTMNSDGSYSYQLNNLLAAVQALSAGQQVQDVFSYQAQDDNGGAADGALTINVTGVNDAPVASSVTKNLLGSVLNQSLGLAAPTDVDQLDTLAITVNQLPSGLFGTLKLLNGTPLSVGQVLSANDLTNLTFSSLTSLGNGTFGYSVSDGTTTTNATVTLHLI